MVNTPWTEVQRYRAVGDVKHGRHGETADRVYSVYVYCLSRSELCISHMAPDASRVGVGCAVLHRDAP